MGKVIVRIREVATGEQVEVTNEVDDRYIESQGFYYEMGNGSCDCNRKLEFGHAQGINFTDEETPCGESAFEVRVEVNGQVVWNELD